MTRDANVALGGPRGMQRLAALLLFIALLPGCSVLPEAKPVPMDRFLLDARPVLKRMAPAAPGAVLLVTEPRASAALDTPRMAYQPRAHVLRYFANSRWADSPVRMLHQAMVAAFGDSGRYRAVLAGSGAGAEVRLDTWLEAFQQDFSVTPSRFRVVLRVQWTDLRTRNVVATRMIEVSEPAAAGDAYAGALAANAAVANALSQLVAMESGDAEPRVAP